MQSVSFSIEQYAGFVEIVGLVRIEGDTVVLEFRKKRGYLVSRFQD